MSGWSPAPLRRKVSPDPERWPSLVPAEGQDELYAVVNGGLTFRQINEIPIGPGVTYGDLWKSIAPYILEWNVMGETEDGEWVPLSPPAEAGHEVFLNVRYQIAAWLSWELKYGVFQENDLGKASKPLKLMEPTSSEKGTEDPTSETSQKSHGDSTSSTGSTRPRRRRKTG